MTSTAAVHTRTAAPLVTEVLPHLDARFGGIATSVPRASLAAAAAGRHRGSLVAFCDPNEQAPAEAGLVDVFPLGRRKWIANPAQRRRLEEVLSQGDAFHVHGLWQEHASMTAAHAHAHRKPYIASAHGMLDAWAFRHRGLKKRVYAALIERPNLEAATCLRALTRTEYEDFRRFGLRNPVAIIPNGVDIPAIGPDRFLARFPELRGKRLVLYMGRIHHKKGPALLCRAWARVREAHPEAHLMMAGPDFENTSTKIARLLVELGIEQSVSMPGLLSAPYTWSALRAASLFVLPSYSEGFSRAVLEAMGCGAPVLITHACNFPEVAQHDCGVIVDADEHALTLALSDLLTAPHGDLRQMGRRGARLVQERYTWDVVGRQLSALYGWILGGGAPPAQLHVEYR